MVEMEYGQQAIAAQEAAEAARGHEARMAAEAGNAPAAPEEDTEEEVPDASGMIELHGDIVPIADDGSVSEDSAISPQAPTEG